ncbi:hypothetical protein [Amycolatopsis sp. YIM 10]|uniref:hypothetical protein n=1 Tax=Amycolatopsis sp. YIM 10 TaxID=2653857 RepID=UPI0012901F29|nr:hypothetical protein [Amycolatopsis sp. YIM 10]QFU86780.1 hypothetical protein YIM_07845 [Amycolatopsis sp. YIM 10]
MDKLLPGLGTKLAERWINLLALPGVLFTVVLAFSWWVHPVGAVDLDALGRRLTEIAVPKQGTQLTMVASIGAVIATACAAIAAELSRPIARIWTGRDRGAILLLQPFLRRRIRKVRAAAPAGYGVPERYLPARATRIGDHIRLAEERIAAQYGVALVRVWPRLWHMSNADERAMTQHAWDRYTAAAMRAAWAVGYLLTGLLWWPAAVAGLLLYLSAWSAARRAAADLQTAIEALTDVKLLDLAAAIGISPAHGKFTPNDGAALETVLDKGSFLTR